MAYTINTPFFVPLTTRLAKIYDEVMEIKPTGFLQTFAETTESRELYPAIEVRRGSEKIAIDVPLGVDGNRNQLTDFSRTIYDLFYYNDFVDLTKNAIYQVLFSSEQIGVNANNRMANEIAVGLKAIEDKFIRAREVQVKQVLETGTQTSYRDGSVITYGRKAASFKTLGAGNWWSVSGTDPYQDFSDAGVFLREQGKITSNELVAIVGQSAYLALKNNSTVLIQNDLKSWQIDKLVKPIEMAEGATYMGYIVAYTYTVHLFAYNQFFEDPANNGALTPYIAPNNVYVLPSPAVSKPFTGIFGACPQITSDGSNITGNLMVGKVTPYQRIIPQMGIYQFGLESRPLFVPYKVDQMYTMTVLPS